MPVTLEDAKRTAIAEKLADIKAVQELVISNERTLIDACTDNEICNRLRDFLKDDQKNLGIIDTVIVQYGIKAEPKQTVKEFIKKSQQAMSESGLTLLEKVSQHELLKHQQAMSGILVHKAAQVVGADIEAAITPLNTVNFENRAHQEQLKGVLEILSTRELTGQEADQGLWARVQDSIAALTGIAGSVLSRTDDEMTIRDLIRMDHTKANTLFVGILGSNDPQKIQEFYGQLYKDLNAHASAEEEVVYPAVRPYYNDTQDLYSEQAEMKQNLERIKAMSTSQVDTFKGEIEKLMKAVQHHVRQEENEMFPKIRDNFSKDQEKRMATDFKTAKSKIQDEALVTAK